MITKNDYTGLLFKCPFDKELPGCPFHKIRVSDAKEKIEMLNKEERFMIMVRKHQECFAIRESKMKNICITT